MNSTHMMKFIISFVFSESVHSLQAQSREEQTDAGMQMIIDFMFISIIYIATLSDSELPNPSPTVEVEQRDMEKGTVSRKVVHAEHYMSHTHKIM